MTNWPFVESVAVSMEEILPVLPRRASADSSVRVRIIGQRVPHEESRHFRQQPVLLSFHLAPLCEPALTSPNHRFRFLHGFQLLPCRCHSGEERRGPRVTSVTCHQQARTAFPPPDIQRTLPSASKKQFPKAIAQHSMGTSNFKNWSTRNSIDDLCGSFTLPFDE